MSLRTLPEIMALTPPESWRADAPGIAVERWQSGISAAAPNGEDTISILDVIGYDWWTGEGTTAKRIAAALRQIGDKPVSVMMNSPGGDVFEGLAIYNALRAHPAKVTINVLGLAASAASIIAMAGDEIVMGLGSQMMVHRSWGATVGNANDHLAASDILDGIDRSLTEIYVARTGLSDAKVLSYLDGPMKASDGTWFTAKEAVEAGFADRVDEALKVEASAPPARADIAARRQLDDIFAKAGLSRSEGRRVFSTAAKLDAGGQAMPGAGLSQTEQAALRSLIETMKA